MRTAGKVKHIAVKGGWDGVATEDGQEICKLSLNNPDNATFIALAWNCHDGLVAALPDPGRLEILADWFDNMFPGDLNPETQSDLRRWAKNIREALALAKQEAPE